MKRFMSTFKSSAMKDAREYYDDYSYFYEKKRKRNYHILIDRLELDLLKKYCYGKRVLDAGCGTGIMLSQIKGMGQIAFGIDLSGEMLKSAQRKDLRLVQGRLSELPFKEKTFDMVYSFKVLPHVPQIEETISEMVRVTDKDGYLILGFYNPYSLRYLIKILKRPTKVSDMTRDNEVFTRYDSYKKIREIIPDYLGVEAIRGIRIFTPFSFVHDIPILSMIFKFLERIFCDTCLKYFAGFLIIVLRHKKDKT